MLKFMKKMYNHIYKFHRIITKKTQLGLTNAGLIFLFPPIIVYIIIYFVHSENIKDIFNTICAYYFICFVLIILPYFQVMFLILRRDKKNRRISIDRFFSNSNYLLFCVKTTFVFMGSTWFILNIFFNINIFRYFMSNISYIITIFFVLFSIISIFWFSYLIIYKLLEEQVIKTKLSLYIAFASTVNLMQIAAIREYIGSFVSFSVIIVSYRWINYLIEEKELQKKLNARNKCKRNIV